MQIDFNTFAPEFITIVLAVAGLITAVGGAAAVISKWYKNSKPSKHDEIIKQHSEEIKELKESVTELQREKGLQERYINTMCNAMLALLDHNINGNSIDKLKEAKEEMKEFLINRG